MSEITVKRYGRFTVLPNEAIQDRSLSLKARGLLVYMLSLPNDWDYSIAGLVKVTGEGKASIQSGLKELENRGYLDRRQVKANGKFSHNEYVVYDFPTKIIDPPLTDFPPTEKPPTEKPSTENQPQQNTNKQNTNKQNTKRQNTYREFIAPTPMLTAEQVKTQEEYFCKFWEAYPRKVKRPIAWYEWKKLPYDISLYEKVLKSVEDYKGTNQWQDINYIPYPESFLQDERYNDELTPSQTDGIDPYGDLIKKYGEDYGDK